MEVNSKINKTLINRKSGQVSFSRRTIRKKKKHLYITILAFSEALKINNNDLKLIWLEMGFYLPCKDIVLDSTKDNIRFHGLQS
jgi:hypothetical protein